MKFPKSILQEEMETAFLIFDSPNHVPKIPEGSYLDRIDMLSLMQPLFEVVAHF